MKRTSQLLSFFLVFMTLFAMTVPANAALKAVGPTDLVTTLPMYYQDPANLALQPCLDQNLMCVLTPNFDPNPAAAQFRTPPFGPLLPITTTGPISDTNFPDESFYFLADSIITTPSGAKLVYRAALEAAFLAGVSPNQGITFLRIVMRKASNLAPNTTYTVTHPYGTFTVSTDSLGSLIVTGAGQAYRVEDPLAPAPGAYFPPDMQAATATKIGPFLQRAAGLITDVATGNQYIGDPALAVTVTGSPFGTNFFRVEGPNINPGPANPATACPGALAGPNCIQTTDFNLAGRVFTGTVASPMTIDRATYARDAATGQVDIFVTALTAASLTVSGTGITTTTMTEDVPGTGKFFAHFPFTTTLPSALSITNSLDLPIPIPHPVTLVDEVNITQATYDPATKNLTIKAASRDKVAPPVLTAPQFVAPNTLDATGTLVVPLTTTIPPLTIAVTSSHGGEAIAPVSVVTPPPVANNDVAVVGAGGSVVINVLANDTAVAPATLDATSVVASLATRGTVAVNATTGAITYTPTGLTAGVDTFTYTVKDSNLHLSNVATVTVEIIASGTAPVAVADTATVAAGGNVPINVVANDTVTAPAAINPASVTITATTGGTALAGATGTVSYTAPAAPGTYTFSYTVKDNSAPPVTSNPAPVTVTVTGVVANNDSASTVVGAPVAISVLANDTSVGPNIINPASITVFQPAVGGGSVVANATGTVTYTPPALAGTYTFGYTVRNNAAVPAGSNLATVTVKVGVAPVAVNDTATALVGSAVTINVIGNDTATLPATIDPATITVSTPTGGTAVANANGTVTYTAPATAGTYEFAYDVRDTATPPATSEPAVVTVTVTASALPPVAGNDTSATVLGTPVTINVIANDSATAPAAINPASVVVTQPALGGGSVVANATGTVTYTPPALAGTYSFTYTVKDNAVTPLTSNVATVTVTVAAANVAPVAGNDTASTVTNGTITISVLANDSSTTSTLNPASVVVTQPALGGGTATANATGTVTYAAPAVAGTYTFTYTFRDNAVPALTSNVATVTVTVTAVDIPPTANNDTATATTGGTVTINVIANDTSATSTINPATVVVTQPALGGGTATANPTGTVSYTAPALAGTYTFTYTVNDNFVPPATSNIATVTVTVTAPAVAPVAGNNTATMVAGAGASTIINVIANDTATAPATINAASVVIVTPPLNGTAAANLNGTVTYTPAAGFVGTNSFTYTVSDSNGLVSNIATVTVTVNAPATETLAVTIAQFTVAGSVWRVEGTTTARTAGETINIYNGATVAGSPLIGSATVTNGVWKFNLKPGPVANTLRRISIQSSLAPPATLEGITLVVR
jgi:large repetitive protein